MRAQSSVTVLPLKVTAPPTLRVRWFAIALTLLLVAAFTVASGWASLTRYEIMGTGYLPRSVVPLFLIIVLVNAGLRFLFPSLALTRSELLFVFAILSAIAAVSGQEYANHFYLNLLGLVYYNSPQSQWFNMFVPHLPPYLVPSLNFRDPAILWAYEGMPAGAKLPLGEWLIPLIAWTPYLVSVYGLLVCLCLIFSRQWEEHERLLYPLTQVPLELSGSEERTLPVHLFCFPLFWLGFAAAVLPYALRGLHLYFPTIPDPRPQRTSEILFPTGPLSAFNGVNLHYYPEMVGIAYLLSREVGLSLWLFPFIRRGEVALRMAIGQDMYHNEFLTFQSVAAYLVMAASLVWIAKVYLKEVLFSALKLLLRPFKKGSDIAMPTEGKALWALILSLAFIFAWSKWVAGVMLSWVAMMFVGLLITGLVVARIVAEAGVYIYSPPFRVYQVMFDVFGKNRMGARNIVLLTAMSWVQFRSTATMATGYFINSLRLGFLANSSRGKTALWIFLAIVVAILVCHVVFPSVIYNYSVPKLGWWPQTSSLNTANFIGQYLTTSRPLTPHHWWGLIIGALTCWLLIKLRLSFVGFPLHPIGFITWFGWPLDRYWLSVLLGWLLKSVVLKYGGFSAFQKGKPFAYGMVVGGATNLTFWILLRLLYPTSDIVIYD